MTKDKQQWLEGRRRGIGGSDVAAVLQLSPWRTPFRCLERQAWTLSGT
ncbi:MAG: YqaJ viral recombinase family protein [Parasutterella sp.]